MKTAVVRATIQVELSFSSKKKVRNKEIFSGFSL